MNHLTKLFLTALLWAPLAAIQSRAAAASPADNSDQPPNIILVNIDDLGPAWLPPYARNLKPSDVEEIICQNYAKEKALKGETFDLQKHLDAAGVSMPAVDSLARQGAVFNWCFSTASICAPSRSALMTGRYQERWGAFSIPDVMALGIPAKVPCLVETLHQAGYKCGLIGKWHVAMLDPAIWTQAEAIVDKKGGLAGPAKRAAIAEAADSLGHGTSCAPGQHPLDRGFDYYFGYNKHSSTYYDANDLWENHARVPKRPAGEFLTDLFNQQAAQFVTHALDDGRHFFLYYAPMTVHGALLPPPEKYSSQFHTGIKQTDEFAGHLRALDDGIRQIFEILKAHHQDQNTLFILTADNGPAAAIPPYNAPLHGGKGTGWLGGTHEPLIIYWPGHVQPMYSDEIVSHMDILPTALDAAGLKPPQPVDGQSLMPLLRGEVKTGPHDRLFSAGLHATNWSYSYFPGAEKEATPTKKAVKLRDERTCPMYVWGLSRNSLRLYITPTRPGLYEAFPQGRPAQSFLFHYREDPQQSKNLLKADPEADQATAAIVDWIRTTTTPTAIHQDDYPLLLKMDPNASLPPAPANKGNQPPAGNPDLNVN